MKRIVSLALALLMLLGMSSACLAETVKLESGIEINLEGMPIVNEPIEFTIMAYVPTGADSYDKLLFTEEMEKRTGIHINWIEVSPLAVTEKVNLALASGDLPDAFFKCAISTEIMEKYAEDEIFVPLNGYLETYMPAFNAALEELGDLGPSIATSDGTIYGVPYANSITAMGGGPSIWYNKKFYDKLGLVEAVTLDDLYNNLVAIRDGDPNGNGEADEIPYLTTIAGAVEYVGAGYSLKNRGNSTGFVDADPADGTKIRFWPADPDYRKTLDFVRKLWAENLMDKDEDMSIPTAIAKYNADRVGLTAELYTQLDAAGPDFAHYTHPLETENGVGLFYRGGSSYGGGNFVITSECEHPEVLMRWVDYFYTEEGMELYFMGVKDKTFIINEKGNLEYTQDILNNPDGLSYVQAFGRYLCWGDGRNPALLHEKYFRGGAEMTDEQLSLTNALSAYLPEEIWPSFQSTEEESKFFSTNGVDIETLVNEFRANWVAGNIENTDEVWNDYIQKLNDMGLEQYIAHKQAALDRYLAK